MSENTNIVDFKTYIQNRLIHEALPDLPDIPIVNEASIIFGDKLARLILLGQLCIEANDAIIAAGFDPVDFHIDDISVDRFFTTDHLLDDYAMFNGVCFDWLTEQGELVRVATTLVFDNEETCPSIVDILRIGPDDDHWEILDDGEWSDDGPPAEFFEFLEDAWDSAAEEKSGAGSGDGDEDGDEYSDDWEDDRTLAQLNISVDTYNKLDAAGIETMDELADLKEKTVAVLVGEAGLLEVRAALDEYGLELQ